MKIISIDIGIKNLSFCFFETNENSLKIVKWDNINLSEKEEYKCIEMDKNVLCDKPAKFTKDDKCYCLKHSKKHNYLHPSKELSQSALNKLKIQQLVDIANKYKLVYENPPKKPNLLAIINAFIEKHCYTSVTKTNATKVDLVTIGRNMQHKFDVILSEQLATIDTIIIENQIGPLANKMKTIQGMISQYFIMKNNNIRIEFISASNKLKDYINANDKKEKLDYKQRKALAVKTTTDMVTNDEKFKEWEPFFVKHLKKDDLSDCFLQGLWFIKHKV
jgi:hypothetical protein